MKQFVLACLSAGSILTSGAILQPATAAPFCISNQLIKNQCIYYDAEQCAHEANRQNATCESNPAELPLSRNVGQYCVVTSGRISNCTYFDRATCDRDATRLHATCTSAPTRIGSGAPDPYSATGGR